MTFQPNYQLKITPRAALTLVLANAPGPPGANGLSGSDGATGPAGPAGAGSAPAVRVVTAAGDVTVGAGDENIVVNKTVGAATNVILPTSASRAGVPVRIKDGKFDAATNNLTLVPNGAETLDGFSAAAANANGVSKIDWNGGAKMLYPLAAGGWYFL